MDDDLEQMSREQLIKEIIKLGQGKRFAGHDFDVPVFEPEARRLLSKVEPLARHYDVRKHPNHKFVTAV